MVDFRIEDFHYGARMKLRGVSISRANPVAFAVFQSRQEKVVGEFQLGLELLGVTFERTLGSAVDILDFVIRYNDWIVGILAMVLWDPILVDYTLVRCESQTREKYQKHV